LFIVNAHIRKGADQAARSAACYCPRSRTGDSTQSCCQGTCRKYRANPGDNQGSQADKQSTNTAKSCPDASANTCPFCRTGTGFFTHPAGFADLSAGITGHQADLIPWYSRINQVFDCPMGVVNIIVQRYDCLCHSHSPLQNVLHMYLPNK
jgi:hypothetical protein